MKCNFCGCTDDRACLGGCHWVAPNVCSQCAEKLLPKNKPMVIMVKNTGIDNSWVPIEASGCTPIYCPVCGKLAGVKDDSNIKFIPIEQIVGRIGEVELPTIDIAQSDVDKWHMRCSYCGHDIKLEE